MGKERSGPLRAFERLTRPAASLLGDPVLFALVSLLAHMLLMLAARHHFPPSDHGHTMLPNGHVLAALPRLRVDVARE
jgi:hypothetical protein